MLHCTLKNCMKIGFKSIVIENALVTIYIYTIYSVCIYIYILHKVTLSDVVEVPIENSGFSASMKCTMFMSH